MTTVFHIRLYDDGPLTTALQLKKKEYALVM